MDNHNLIVRKKNARRKIFSAGVRSYLAYSVERVSRMTVTRI